MDAGSYDEVGFYKVISVKDVSGGSLHFLFLFVYFV